MRVVKRINNNAAICEDAAGRQLIALGRGIGFGDLPREVSLADVQRTFYDIDDKYLALIDEVDPTVLEFAAQLADIATQQLSYDLSPNLPITLADHTQFALKRAREHLILPMPLSFDIEQQHPLEYRLGEIAVRGIRKTFDVRLPANEATGFALSLLNAAVTPSQRQNAASKAEDELLERFTHLIEERFNITVDRRSFAFSRFATHIRYLLKRVEDDRPIDSGNAGLFGPLSEQYPEIAACATEMGYMIEEAFERTVSEEELVYLIMHINRIVAVQSTP